ncbi:MAG TPA: hypothetical protein V6C46_04310 [Coleofasciculaceae cyanobacterium]
MNLLLMIGLATGLLGAVFLFTIGWHLVPFPLLWLLFAILLVTHALLMQVQRQLAAASREAMNKVQGNGLHSELRYRGSSYQSTPSQSETVNPASASPLTMTGKYRGSRWGTVKQSDASP